MSKITYGIALRKLRRSVNITQTELANHLGLSAAYISAVEKGKRSLLTKAVTSKILELLGPDDELMELAGKKFMECGCRCLC